MITPTQRQRIEDLFDELLDDFQQETNRDTLDMEHYYHNELKILLDDMENTSA